MGKRVLIHSLIFSPDGVSTAYLYNDIALRFQKEGYDVVVLTTTPHYNIVDEELKKQPLKWKCWGICKESNFNGIKVLHVPQKKFKSTILRLIGFIYWHIISFITGLFINKIDIILSPSPPLTIGVVNIMLAKIKGAKVIYNVQEIYPDILKKKDGFIISILKKMEHWVYNSSDAVTTIDQVFYDTIVDRFDEKTKLHIIPNFVDTDLYYPQNLNSLKLDKKLFPDTDSLKLLYAGNIGFAQDWKPLVALVDKLKNENIDFFVIGEGVMKSFLEQQKKELKLDRLHILEYQPRELMPRILSYSDIQFIFMDPDMDMQGFPSKVYTIMACAKPLLICSGAGTPIVNFLNSCDCAKIVTEIDFVRKVENMREWLVSVSNDELNTLGYNGFEVINSNYTKEIVTGKYLEIINNL